MRKLFEELTTSFRHHEGRLTQGEYEEIVAHNTTLFEDSETIFILLQASGYPISYDDDGLYRLETYFTPYTKQRFCIIDIETNGSKPESSQVIEIGAVMVEGGAIVDTYESFVACAFVPEYVTKITGIEQADLAHAPSQSHALHKLREFMGDAIFVAHNASFDFSFLDDSFNRFGLGDIGNQRLCTIDLARRTFESERYGLAYLNEFLGVKTATHHRALSDAYSAYHVMEHSLKTLPYAIHTTDELLEFATSSQKERGEKKREQGSRE